ncbi:hypothetical protein RHS04_09326 [Rhizoctonia solani]|uniref:Uncharacterized protein n=1 Tax=Rhizoctonia solani TaxID=456999 RepID=A0A8H7LFP9_9AGAM|nr:hypothetical protein RHS04_09326 [Rhizoctonia solani]
MSTIVFSTLDTSTGWSLTGRSTSITPINHTGHISNSITTLSSSSIALTSFASLSSITDISSTTPTAKLTPVTQSLPVSTSKPAATQFSTVLSQTSVNQNSLSQTPSIPSPVTSVAGVSSVTASYHETTLSNQQSETPVHQNTRPTSTEEPHPVPTTSPETVKPSAHRLFISLGDCADFTSPRLRLGGGELSDLVAVDAGRFEVELRSDQDSNYFSLDISLDDGGIRCGTNEQPSCTAIFLGYGGASYLEANVIISRKVTAMYPFSIWLEDGVAWDGRLTDSAEKNYHCWGWSDAECPNAFKNSGSNSVWWTLSSNNPTGSVYIDFCPPDGPTWSNVPPNPSSASLGLSGPTGKSTYIVLPTQTTIPVSTFIRPIEVTKLGAPAPDDDSFTRGTRTFFVGKETITHISTFITPIAETTRDGETGLIIGSTTTVLETSFLGMPMPTRISSEANTSTAYLPIQTIRSPSTSFSAPEAASTYSYITDSLGLVISTLTYDPTVPPAPTITSAPGAQYTFTSWSTWMTINGSIAPAIAGEVGVVSTVSETYLFESGSIIPVSELSTLSTKSAQTGTPSPTGFAKTNGNSSGQSQGGKIAGAVVGTLVGLVLGSLLLWYICHRRQRRRRRDSFARGDPSWLAPRHEVGSGSTSRLRVDLNEEPRMSRSYIEPWVPPRAMVQSSRKGDRPEMEHVPRVYGVSKMAATSRETESSSNESGPTESNHSLIIPYQVPVTTTTQTSRSTSKNEPRHQPDVMASHQPVPTSHLNSSSANPSLSLLPTPSLNESPGLLTLITPPIRTVLLPTQADPPTQAGPSRRRHGRDEEQGGHDAIPPLYNEAWKTAR